MNGQKVFKTLDFLFLVPLNNTHQLQRVYLVFEFWISIFEWEGFELESFWNYTSVCLCVYEKFCCNRLLCFIIRKKTQRHNLIRYNLIHVNINWFLLTITCLYIFISYLPFHIIPNTALPSTLTTTQSNSQVDMCGLAAVGDGKGWGAPSRSQGAELWTNFFGIDLFADLIYLCSRWIFVCVCDRCGI